MTTENFTQTTDSASTLTAVDCMSQKRLERMATLAQEAISGKRKSNAVLATLRDMVRELQDEINFMAETAGCNHTTV